MGQVHEFACRPVSRKKCRRPRRNPTSSGAAFRSREIPAPPSVSPPPRDRRGSRRTARDPSRAGKSRRSSCPMPGETRVVSPETRSSRIHLVKWILRLAFALEDQLLAVRREIAFAAAFPFEDELPWIREETLFLGAAHRARSAAERRITARERTPDILLVPKLCSRMHLFSALCFASIATELPGQLRSQTEFGNEKRKRSKARYRPFASSSFPRPAREKDGRSRH